MGGNIRRSFLKKMALGGAAMTVAQVMRPESAQAAVSNQSVAYPESFGIVGQGDDTAAVQAALNSNANCVVLSARTYVVRNLMIKSNTTLRGAGIGASILLQKAGTAGSLLRSENWNALTGTDQSNTPAKINIYDLTLDGNRRSNPEGQYCLAMYARDWRLENVTIRGAMRAGIHSEWAGTLGQPIDGEMEAFISNIKVYDCGEEGIIWKGPHDSFWSNVFVFENSMRANAQYSGVVFDTVTGASTLTSGGVNITNLHVYGGSPISTCHKYAVHLKQSGGVHIVNGQLEGAYYANLYLENAGACVVDNVRFYYCPTAIRVRSAYECSISGWVNNLEPDAAKAQNKNFSAVHFEGGAGYKGSLCRFELWSGSNTAGGTGVSVDPGVLVESTCRFRIDLLGPAARGAALNHPRDEMRLLPTAFCLFVGGASPNVLSKKNIASVSRVEAYTYNVRFAYPMDTENFVATVTVSDHWDSACGQSVPVVINKSRNGFTVRLMFPPGARPTIGEPGQVNVVVLGGLAD